MCWKYYTVYHVRKYIEMGRRGRGGLLKRLGIKRSAKQTWKSAGRQLRPFARGMRKLGKQSLRSAGDLALASAQGAMGIV